MKSFCFSCFLLCANFIYANKIDKLITNDEVRRFLIHNVSSDLKYKDIFTKENAVASNQKQFSKVDVDHNGLTDLVVHGNMLFVVLDNGVNGYIIRYLSQRFSFDKSKLVSIDKSLPVKLIITQKENETDTLVYKFHDFIEYNPAVNENFKFEGLKFTTGTCLGECPVFELTIQPNRQVTYNAIQFNDEKGIYTGVVDEDGFRYLIDLLKYLNIDSLEKSYAVDWLDDQFVETVISYNGTSKKINDYGKLGSFGLKRLYSLLFSWRIQMEWSKY